MKSYIIDTLTGVFALDENGNFLNFIDFNDDDDAIIKFYLSLEEDKLSEEYVQLLEELKNTGYEEFIFDNKTLQSLTKSELGYQTSLHPTSPEFKNFRLHLIEQLAKIGIIKDLNELSSRYKKVSAEIIKKQVSQASSKNDIIIIQVIETLETIKKSISLFSSKLREWYGLYFPELTDKIVEDNIMLAKIVSVLGQRQNFTQNQISESFDFNPGLINILKEKAKISMGANFDLTMIKEHANQILALDSHREKLEEHLDELMEKTAPNIKAIIGSLIGAKIIAKAGNLRKLAFMPASRVQLLGAEKALYRFLKTGEDRPKHGIIFQWNQIRGSKPWIRGKISRLVAGKLGLMAKVDYFSGDFVGDEISEEIEQKIQEIEQKYPNPPKNKARKSGKQQHNKKGKKRKR